MDFNPRPRMGSDLISFFGIAAFFRISIHAPRMGSDDSVDIPFDRILISIHAPRMGSDWG